MSEGERIDAGPPVQVRALRAGPVPRPKRCGRGSEPDAAGFGFEKSGHPRLGQIATDAGMDDPGRVEMSYRRQHAAFAVIECVVIGTADQIDTKPLDVVEQVRRRRHVGAARNAGGSFIPASHHAFEIGKARIAVAVCLDEG